MPRRRGGWTDGRKDEVTGGTDRPDAWKAEGRREPMERMERMEPMEPMERRDLWETMKMPVVGADSC